MSPPSDLRQRLVTTVANPIWVKCARERLRRAPVLSWGLVTVTVTAFLCVLAFVAVLERGHADPVVAAKSMLLPIVILQAVLLMLLGTGAVASKLAFEREMKLLDYQRMTPMSPAGKIVGYLFGLPVREYLMFALTLPFLGYALVRGEFSPSRIVPFYVVFFSSVVLYHLTGMVAGMATEKPRRAQILSQGMIVLPYIFLPQMSRLGLTFFEFLTFVPTFNGLVLEELREIQPGLERAAAQSIPLVEPYRRVPFFGLTVHPTIFTLIVQGFLILTMFVVVHRKWLDQAAHVFSKIYGLVFYAGTLVLLVGSLWPSIVEKRFYGLLTETIQADLPGDDPRPYLGLLFILLVLFGLLTGLFSLLTVHFTTPSREITLKGLRRARKLGRTGLGLNSDAASSLPLVLVNIGITAIAWWILVSMAARTGSYIAGLPSLLITFAPIALHAAVVLFVHGLRERHSLRAFLMAVFLLWMLPSFVALILVAANRAPVLAGYLALPFPPFSIIVTVDEVFAAAPMLEVVAERGAPHMIIDPIAGHRSAMTLLAIAGYGVLALFAQVGNIRHRRRLRAAAAEVPLPHFHPPTDAGPGAGA